MSNKITLPSSPEPDDQHNRVRVYFEDEESGLMISVTIAWILENGGPINSDTDIPLVYVYTQLVH